MRLLVKYRWTSEHTQHLDPNDCEETIFSDKPVAMRDIKDMLAERHWSISEIVSVEEVGQPPMPPSDHPGQIDLGPLFAAMNAERERAQNAT